MKRLVLSGMAYPLHQLLHAARRVKRAGCLKHHGHLFALRVEGGYMVGHLFVPPKMVAVLAAVLEQIAVELLDMVFVEGNMLPRRE